jgi:ribosomal protein S27AE
MDPTETLKASSPPTGTSDATAVNHSLVSASGEQCPSCGNAIVADQRYCLHCGQRCGEPRLPFMNATTFMDTMKRPAQAQASPPAPKQRRRLSPNAALIAGVGTLLLAMGVGVLIGHSGNQSVATNPAPPQVITVHGGGGETENTPTATNQKSSGGKGGKKSGKGSASAKKKAETGQGAEEVLKPSSGVKLPPATAAPGSKCESGAAGCKGGEFTGEFFGE